MGRRPSNPYASVGLSKEDIPAIWRRINAAAKHHERVFNDAEKLVQYYAGKQFEMPTPDGDHAVVVNRVLPNLELKRDAIGFTTPEFIMKAASTMDEEAAKVGKAALVHFWETEETQRELKRALHDALICRFGVVQIGWTFETEDGVCLSDDRLGTEGDAIDPATMAEMVSEGKDPLSQIPRDRVLKDAPSVKRIRPGDFMIEPGADYDVEQARYVVWRETMPLDEVKADPRYSGTDALKGDELYQDYLLDDRTRDLKPEERPDDCKCVTLYHYYERKRRIHCVYAKDNEQQPLLTERFPWDYDGYPFAVIVAHEIPDQSPAECKSDLDLIKPLQDATNVTRSVALNHIEQFTAKFQTRAGSLTPAARRQLKSTRRGTIVEHTGIGDQAIFPLPVPQIPSDIYAVEQRSQSDIDYVLGVSDYMRNTVAEGRRTATEVAAIQQSGSARVDSSVIHFSRFAEQVAEKVLALLQQFAYHTITLPIFDEATNVQAFVGMNVDTIRGQYRVKVEVGSTQAQNEESEKQNMIFLLQTLTPYAQLIDPMTGAPAINLIPLIRKIISRFGLKGAANEIISPPQPPPVMTQAPPFPALTGQDPQAQLAALFGQADPSAMALPQNGAQPPQ